MPKNFKQIKRKYALVHRRSVRRVKRVIKRPFFSVPAATFMVLLVIGLVTFIVANGGKPSFKPTNSTIVIVDHDNQRQTVPTSAKTVGDLLNRLHVTLNQGDVVEPSKDTVIVQDNFHVNVYRAVPVTIIDGSAVTYSYSAAATARSIVKQSGVTVYPEDELKLEPTQNFLTDSSIGERVVIERATPVNVNLYGTPVTLRTHAKTVGDLLKAQRITLHDGDTVQPAANEPVTTNVQVFVIHKGKQIQSVEQDIAMPVQTIEDSSLTFGTTAVRQQGSVGKQVITYEVDLQNGKEVGRKVIQQVTTVQPVTQIIAKGKAVQIPSDKQAVMALAGISSGDYAYVDYIVSHESGWCPTKLQGNPGACPAYPPDSIPTYLGYGLGQATPGTKMASFGSDWQVSAVTQLKWATSYAVGRYGSWGAAYNHWQSSHNW